MDKYLGKLKEWYLSSARPLPWRATSRPDPYKIWISEVMSQQSTMAMLLPYYEKWMQRFPTIETLAESSESEVLSAWAGLGYYSRARNVHHTARALVAQGAPRSWPQTHTAWQQFKGVGPYTAAAVTAISFDQPQIPVDGNVLRVGARFFGISDPLNFGADRRKLDSAFSKVSSKTPKKTRAIFAQAFMELGAQICRPQANLTLCELCPLKKGCYANLNSRVFAYPIVKKRPMSLKLIQLGLLYQNAKGEFLFRQIPKGQRLEGQWEIPLLGSESEPLALEESNKIRGLYESWGPVKHSITRFRFQVYGLKAGLWRGKVPKGHVFSTGKNLTLSTLSRKLLKNSPFFS